MFFDLLDDNDILLCIEVFQYFSILVQRIYLNVKQTLIG